jgi:predicted nucleic acid-binding protein
MLDIVLDAHTLVLSRFIIDEVERVLLYPRIQSRLRITPTEAARFCGSLANAAHLVEPVVSAPVILSDPADDPVLYTAADGKADILCTANSRHFATLEARDFCLIHGIRVMTDVEALREVLGESRGGK